MHVTEHKKETLMINDNHGKMKNDTKTEIGSRPF